MAFRLCDAESADDVDKAVFRLFWVEGAVQWQGVDGFVADVSHAESGGVGEEEGGVEFVDVVADEGVVPYESDEVREHLVYGRLVAQIGVGESIETCDLLGQRTLWVDELAVPFDRSAVPDADGPDLHDPVIAWREPGGLQVYGGVVVHHEVFGLDWLGLHLRDALRLLLESRLRVDFPCRHGESDGERHEGDDGDDGERQTAVAVVVEWCVDGACGEQRREDPVECALPHDCSSSASLAASRRARCSRLSISVCRSVIFRLRRSMRSLIFSTETCFLLP